jgi:hypothetical protein
VGSVNLHFTRYEKGVKLSGILYMHRISDERFTGISVRNFRMFRQLCGDSTLKNVVLVSNMWGKVTQEVGEVRERELVGKHFKPALDNDAQFVRHYETTQSSHDIIRRIMKNDPTIFQIQRELVDEGKSLDHTAAGEVVSEEINRLIRRHEADVKALREELRHALEHRDEEARRELEEVTSKLKGQIEKMRKERETMAFRFKEETRRTGEGFEQLQMQVKQTQGNARLGRDLPWVEPGWRRWLARVVWYLARLHRRLFPSSMPGSISAA